jgi:hypothetical protein
MPVRQSASCGGALRPGTSWHGGAVGGGEPRVRFCSRRGIFHRGTRTHGFVRISHFSVASGTSSCLLGRPQWRWAHLARDFQALADSKDGADQRRPQGALRHAVAGVGRLHPTHQRGKGAVQFTAVPRVPGQFDAQVDVAGEDWRNCNGYSGVADRSVTCDGLEACRRRDEKGDHILGPPAGRR